MCNGTRGNIKTLPVRAPILEFEKQWSSKRPTKETAGLYVVSLILQCCMEDNVVCPRTHGIFCLETKMVEICTQTYDQTYVL